jgi:hypothetical protein
MRPSAERPLYAALRATSCQQRAQVRLGADLPKCTPGVLGKYAKVVQSAAHGAVCG